MQIRQRAQGQSRRRTQIPLPGFGQCHPAGNAVPNTAAVDNEQNALATQRLSLHDRDTLACQGMKTIVNRRLITHNVGVCAGIFPWIHIPNLASHILSQARRQLPEDWQRQYNIAPVLMETFVEIPRFSGITYKASGWTRVGTTQGRGRYDTKNEYAKPKKQIWLCPLRKDWKRTLNQ